jgi:Zn-finger nucleic acid-binding protein
VRYLIMQAQTLNCPKCGAAISSDAPQCRYCESKLATVACPSCFGMLFIGSKHCPHCGATAIPATAASLSVLQCPRCAIDMSSVMIGTAPVRECSRCEGLWLDTVVFQLICADREHQSRVLGDALPAAGHGAPIPHEEQVRYIPCPHCRQLMNRINFESCSGVVVDVCKTHGTWFDRDELRQIVEFIRGGGLELSREKARHELELQKEKLRTEAATVSYRTTSITTYSLDDERLGGLSAARGLLKFLKD